MVPSRRHILQLVVGPHLACQVLDPKVYFPGTSTPEGPQHTGPAPWRRMFHPFALLYTPHLRHQHQHHGGVCFTHSLCSTPLIFIINTSSPRIRKLLKLPQLNLNDAMTHAHSIIFPHGLAVIRSILFRNYFTRG